MSIKCRSTTRYTRKCVSISIKCVYIHTYTHIYIYIYISIHCRSAPRHTRECVFAHNSVCAHGGVCVCCPARVYAARVCVRSGAHALASTSGTQPNTSRDAGSVARADGGPPLALDPERAPGRPVDADGDELAALRLAKPAAPRRVPAEQPGLERGEQRGVLLQQGLVGGHLCKHE